MKVDFATYNISNIVELRNCIGYVSETDKTDKAIFIKGIAKIVI